VQNVSQNAQGHVEADNFSNDVDNPNNDVIYSKSQNITLVTNNQNNGFCEYELAKHIHGSEQQEIKTGNVVTEGDYDYTESIMKGIKNEQLEDSYSHLNDTQKTTASGGRSSMPENDYNHIGKGLVEQTDLENDEYDHLNEGRRNASNYPKSTKATDNVYSKCASVNSESTENEYGYNVTHTVDENALRQPQETDKVYSHVSNSLGSQAGDQYSNLDQEIVDTNDIYMNASGI